MNVESGMQASTQEPASKRVTFKEAPLDLLFGLLLVACAFALWIGADYIEGSTRGLMGPSGFPRGVAAVLGISSLIMAIRALLALRSGSHGDEITVDQPLAVLINMVLIVVYPILIMTFGFYFATGPWLVALLFASGNRKIIPIIAYAVGFLVFTKLVFQMVIGVPLP